MNLHIEYTQRGKKYNARVWKVENINKYEAFITREDISFRTWIVKSGSEWYEDNVQKFLEHETVQEIGALIDNHN